MLCQADAVPLEFTCICSVTTPHVTGEETEVRRVCNLSKIPQQATGKEGSEPWAVTLEPEA